MSEKPPSLHLIQRMAQRLGERSGNVQTAKSPTKTNGFDHNGGWATPQHVGVRLDAREAPLPAIQREAAQARPSLDGARSREPASLRLDLTHMRRVGMITPDNLTSQLSNEYRSIKRKILRKARDPQTRATVKNL